MDIVDIGEENRKGLSVREVVACDHVGVNRLVLHSTQNFYSRGPCYIVFEENLCKVVCAECLLKASSFQ